MRGAGPGVECPADDVGTVSELGDWAAHADPNRWVETASGFSVAHGAKARGQVGLDESYEAEVLVSGRFQGT